MANITLSVPEEIYDIMQMHKEVKWSEVTRRALIEYILKLNALDKIMANSKLTMKDVMRLDKKVKKKVSERYR